MSYPSPGPTPPPPEPTNPHSAQIDIQPFDVDPTWRFLWTHGLRWPSVLAFFILFDIITILVTAVQGDLWNTRGIDNVWRDLVSFFTNSTQNRGTTRIPLFQDYAGTVLLVTIPASAALVWKQFDELTRMHTTLKNNECLVASNDVSWRDEVKRLNDRIKDNGRIWHLRLSACFGVAYLLIDSFDREGFYGFLRGRTDQPQGWGQRAYADWWASLHPIHGGFFCLEIVGGYGIYLVATQGTIGVLYIRYLWRTRSIATFRPNLTNVDGYYGWGHVRFVVATIIGGLLAGAGSSLALYIYLDPTVGFFAAVVAVLSIVGLNQIILFSGIFVYRSDVRAFKFERVKQLSQMRPLLTTTMTAEQQSLYQLVTEEMARVASISDVPFQRTTVFAVVTVSFLPFIAALFGVIQSASG